MHIENLKTKFMNRGEDTVNYNDLINMYNSRYNDGEKLWTYYKIIEHMKD